MSDLHSTTVWSRQLTRLRGSAARYDIIPEDSRHPLPSSTRGLAIVGDWPVEDLEAMLWGLNFDVLFSKLCIVFVLFCVTSLTTHKVLTTVDGALDNHELITKLYDSKD